MPLYEYQCRGCSAVSEMLVSSSATEPPTCPRCGEAKLEKQFSTFNARGGESAPSHAAHGGGCGCCSQRPACPYGSVK